MALRKPLLTSADGLEASHLRCSMLCVSVCSKNLTFIMRGSTDGAVFEEFIEQLLPFCGRWPEPKSVLVMDNASFHHTERIEQMCHDAGVKLVYLPPYSPDLNPIEEFFAELKAFIKRHWQIFEDDADQSFDTFLEWCIDMVGENQCSARGHFRHAGLKVEEQ
jgi:transposase